MPTRLWKHAFVLGWYCIAATAWAQTADDLPSPVGAQQLSNAYANLIAGDYAGAQDDYVRIANTFSGTAEADIAAHGAFVAEVLLNVASLQTEGGQSAGLSRISLRRLNATLIDLRGSGILSAAEADYWSRVLRIGTDPNADANVLRDAALPGMYDVAGFVEAVTAQLAQDAQ